MRRTRQPLPTLPQIVAHRMGKWTTCEQAIDAMRAERTVHHPGHQIERLREGDQ